MLQRRAERAARLGIEVKTGKGRGWGKVDFPGRAGGCASGGGGLGLGGRCRGQSATSSDEDELV